MSDRQARADREKAASNVGAVYERNSQIKGRFSHVMECPNTQFGLKRFRWLLSAAVHGKSVVDIGCGDGKLTRWALELGASRAHGIDISERFIKEAEQAAAGDERLSYEIGDAEVYSGQRFDVISGLAILHHLDWRPVVTNLYDNVLKPGGSMIFSEPLGSNLALQAYWRFFPNAHTPDEKPFMRSDIAWIKNKFPVVQIYVYNYTSLYLGLISSQIMRQPDNSIMRAADRIDRSLENIEWMKPAFRYMTLVISKPA